MQTIILKHVQVFVVITFFPDFVLDRGVGGWGQLYPNFFGFLDFFIFTMFLNANRNNYLKGSRD